MQKEPTPVWHSLDSDAILNAQNVSLSQGLSDADVTQRQSLYGLNQLPIRHARPAWLRLLLQFHNPLIYVLLVAYEE